VAEQGVQHLHVHFGTGEATVALLAHLLGGLSYSLTLHAFDIFRNNVNRALLAKKINASRFTITVSESNRRFLVENLPGVDPQKIRVNYNGVDLDRFRAGGDSRERASIFGLGRLIEKKGFMDLLRAVRRLRDDGRSVICRIGGEGPEEKRLRNAIERWELQSVVQLLGPVNEERARELMQRSTCFALPCVEAKDGNVDALPTVLLEALASGCPAISTRLSGVPEIIEDGVSGLLVEPGNDKALARAIDRVLRDHELAASLARAGRRRAEERFDIRRNVAVQHEWLRSVATERATGSVPLEDHGEAPGSAPGEVRVAGVSGQAESG
jgi:glycosyltransferase involved in cell wall biosynthesis